jgi:formylglycine-generating enzyme required for sulfatase activity
LKKTFPKRVVDQLCELLSKNGARTVGVSSLFVDRFLVTQAEFRRFVEETSYKTTAESMGSPHTWQSPAGGPENRYPVAFVSLEDAQHFAQWSGKRLLTSDEWQVLVRCSDRRFYPWGSHFSTDRCNTAESLAGEERSAVDRFPEGANEWGCYDVVGNLEEWTSTKSTDQPEHYLIAGGSWKMTCELYSLTGLFRLGRRKLFTDDLGFRCVSEETSADAKLFS